MEIDNKDLEIEENKQEKNEFVPEVDYISEISKELSFKNFQVQVVLELIAE